MVVSNDLIDFAHLHARPGDGSVNSYAEWIDILKKVKKRLGAKTYTLQFHPVG